jgi:hypothetical protein
MSAGEAKPVLLARSAKNWRSGVVKATGGMGRESMEKVERRIEDARAQPVYQLRVCV